MSSFDRISKEMIRIPEHVTTVDEIHKLLEVARALTPMLRVIGLAGERHIFIKLAAIALRGLELVDAEIEAEKGADE